MTSSIPGWLRAPAVPANDATESNVIGSAFLQDDSPGFLLDSSLTVEPSPLQLQPGECFAGLLIERTLGEGGMATVYRAHDPEQQAPVALKVLDRRLVRRDRHLARFRREARLVARLRHPRIVTVHTYGEDHGCAYLTMQLVEGPTLAEAVNQDGPLEPREAARVVELIARTIDAAHRQRVVHRDLKPSNVMLDPEDGPLVLDFGLAKDLTRDPTLTDTGEILGTPAFLAPEQVSPGNLPVDHRIDVYGLGGLLFFLLTGRPLHPGETSVDVLRHILRHDPPRLREVDSLLPRPLDVICAKALSRDPRDRYQTAADMADDLARYQGQAAIHARLPGPLQRLQRQARSHPWTTALLGLLGLALLAGGVVIRLMITRLALRQRSQQALTMLARAQDHAADGRHGLADQEFLQAMLVAKGAFLEDPADRGLKDALARIKRSRIAYAETRGNWSLADELRHNLARLEGAPEPSPSEARELPEASIRIHALRPGERVVFHALDGAPGQATIEVSADDPQVRLLPGTYLATHQTREGGLESCHLVVVDAGSDHALRLDQNSQPPPGVFRLPARALRDQLD